MYDVIIVGAGPAGLTAAIYTSRRGLSTLILSKDLSGQIVTTPYIENYPGVEKTSGLELMQHMERQVKNFGVEIAYDEVLSVKQEEKKFVVSTKEKKYETKTVILAFGKTPRNLGISTEEKFKGKGVFYCSTCDAPLLKNKIAAVVGGGNSALNSSLYLSSIAKKVYLVHRRDEFRGFETMVEKVKQKKNVEFILDSVVEEFKGEKFLKSVIIKNVKTNVRKEIQVDGVFVEAGYEVKADFIKNLVKLDENNHIVVNEKCETFQPNSNKIMPGIFAAGDVTNGPFKQIVIAAGEGAKAGLQAYNYISASEITTDISSEKYVK
jgi:thioredoxin-disulfide reductase